jgi:hypothetical protein
VRWKVVDERGRTCDAVQPALFDAPVGREIGVGEFRGLEFVHVQARTIVNRLKTQGPLPFSFTINPYRGCSHACTYCFARPTHAYLELDPATEFDSVIVVKVNAVERLRAEIAPNRWSGEAVAMGTNTDPYQRAEGKYHLTQGIIDVLTTRANPFSILTKGDSDPARPRTARGSKSSDARSHRVLDRDPRRSRVAHHRARHAPSRASDGGRRPTQ